MAWREVREHAASLSVAFLVAWFVFSIVFDTKPPIVVEQEYTATTTPVPHNGTLKINYKVVVTRSCPGTGRRVIVDAGYQDLPTVLFETNTGVRADGAKTILDEPFDAEVSVTVPPSAAPGPAHYHNETTFYCNFWQRLLKRGIPANFPVVDFVVAPESLPQLAPDTTLFKRQKHTSATAWFMEKARIASYTWNFQ